MKMASKVMPLGMGALMVMGACAVAPYSALAQEGQMGEAGQRADADLTNASGSLGSKSDVRGVFAYDQGRTSSNGQISAAFGKASAVLCGDKSAFAEMAGGAMGAISHYLQPKTALMLAQSRSVEGDDFQLMSCVCATNGAGGGAAMQANVSGRSVASIAQERGAR